MSRLARALEEYRQALAAERDLIAAELDRVGPPEHGPPEAIKRAPEPPPEDHGAKGKGKQRPYTRSNSQAKRKFRRGETSGRPREFSLRPPKAKPRFSACPSCGREDIAGSPGPGGFKMFHYAPACMLPCPGANLARLKAEDLPEGAHRGPRDLTCAKEALA